MKAMDRIDEVEAIMAEGSPIDMPEWLGIQEQDNDQQETSQPSHPKPVDNAEVCVDDVVKDSLRVIEALDSVDKSKYMKAFSKDAQKTTKTNIAIHHSRIKNRAKEIGLTVPKFLTQRKSYPSYVTLKTEIFTNLSAVTNKGASNTGPGFCTSIVISKLSDETRMMIFEILDVQVDENLLIEMENEVEDVEMEEMMLPLTQQSQQDTLRVCSLC